MQGTKKKILDAALKLFNEMGLVNVRLQHIADEAFVSVGNLAYHYPNKEAIVEALYQVLTKKQRELLAEYRVVPLFDNIEMLIRHTYRLQQQYVFFYLDTLEILRAYPAIGETHQQHISSQVAQLKTILDFNASRGALEPEPSASFFENLAVQIWMTMDMWLTQEAVRTGSTPDEEAYRNAIWNLLIPCFTHMGRLEFSQIHQLPYF